MFLILDSPMKRKTTDIIISAIGAWFLLFSIASLFILINNDSQVYLLWLCNHMGFILGLALLFRSRFWLLAEISLGLLPQLFWSIDFIAYKFFNVYIFNVTSYMFDPSYPKAMYYISMNHLAMVPIALIALYFLGQPKKKAYYGALLHGSLLFIISLFFTNPMQNINCSFKSCMPMIPEFRFYPIVWFGVMILMVLLTYWIVVNAYRKLGVKEV